MNQWHKIPCIHKLKDRWIDESIIPNHSTNGSGSTHQWNKEKQGIGYHGSAQRFLNESMEQAQWLNEQFNELMDHWINKSESMDQWLDETQNQFHKSTRQWMRNYARNELLDQCLNEPMKPDAINQWIHTTMNPNQWSNWSMAHELMKRWTIEQSNERTSEWHKGWHNMTWS